MPTNHTKANLSLWRFRREITLGTLVHIMALVLTLAAGWSNLQKELALIRHELNTLNRNNTRMQQNVATLTENYIQHEYRLRTLEKQSGDAY